MPQLTMGVWERVHAWIRDASWLEKCLLHGFGLEDDRVVAFWSREGPDYPMVEAWTELYHPARDESVLPEFIRVFAGRRAPDDDQVIGFYRDYGPLDPQGYLDRFFPLTPGGERDTLPEDTLQALAEPVWWVRACALKLKKAWSLYTYLQRDNRRRLKEHLGPAPMHGQITDVGIGEAGSMWWWVAETQALDDGRQSMARRELSDDEALRWARVALLKEFNAVEERVHQWWVPAKAMPESILPRTRPGEHGRPEHFLQALRVAMTRPLRDALWLQLSEKADAQALLRICPGCEKPFVAKRSDQEHCTPRCRDKHRMKRYYRDVVKPRRGRSQSARGRGSPGGTGQQDSTET